MQQPQPQQHPPPAFESDLVTTLSRFQVFERARQLWRSHILSTYYYYDGDGDITPCRPVGDYVPADLDRYFSIIADEVGWACQQPQRIHHPGAVVDQAVGAFVLDEALCTALSVGLPDRLSRSDAEPDRSSNNNKSGDLPKPGVDRPVGKLLYPASTYRDRRYLFNLLNALSPILHLALVFQIYPDGSRTDVDSLPIRRFRTLARQHLSRLSNLVEPVVAEAWEHVPHYLGMHEARMTIVECESIAQLLAVEPGRGVGAEGRWWEVLIRADAVTIAQAVLTAVLDDRVWLDNGDGDGGGGGGGGVGIDIPGPADAFDIHDMLEFLEQESWEKSGPRDVASDPSVVPPALRTRKTPAAATPMVETLRHESAEPAGINGLIQTSVLNVDKERAEWYRHLWFWVLVGAIAAFWLAELLK